MKFRLLLVALLSPGCVWTLALAGIGIYGLRPAYEAGQVLLAIGLIVLTGTALVAYGHLRVFPHWIARKEAEHWTRQLGELFPGLGLRHEAEPVGFPGLSRVVIDVGGHRERKYKLLRPVTA